jgi:DNA polymerase-3 subunit gamma/tau
MYRALYRKWRPRDFDDVCGQEQITDILKYEVANKKTSHAYLFCGSRSTGKTTCAKILAKAVNCEDPQNGNPCNRCAACRAIDAGTATDVIEMDAASNTGVDNVRDIKDEIVFLPAELTYRVYIIDEVHMMSGSAFNALLKTLEEPPAHVVFILATTELQKLPSTIVSRCQRFDFRRLSSNVIVDRLAKISASEGIDLQEGGARLLARMALGGMRDAISLLELCAGMNRTVDETLVTEVLGAGNRATVEKLVRAIGARDYPTIYETVAEETMSSRDLLTLCRDLIDCYRDLLVVKTAKSAQQYLDLTDVETERLTALAAEFGQAMLLYHSRLLEQAQADMQRSDSPRRTILELTLTRMCEPKLSTTPESLLARIESLEEKLSRLQYGGVALANQQAAAEKTEENGTKNKADKASAAKQTVAQAAAPQENGLVYRQIAGWSEIVEKISKTRPSLHGFLDTAKAYRSSDGQQYLLRVSSDFCARMLKRPETELALKVAIAEEEERDASACTLIIEGAEHTTGYHLVDEIAEALGDRTEQ